MSNNQQKFIFVRHGQSDANAKRYIADAHAVLTQEGVAQAKKTGQEVRDLGITSIACSPYTRTRQTAETIADELGISSLHIKVIDSLRERALGELENNPKEHDGLWYFVDETSESIEPRQDLLDRMHRCLDMIKNFSGDGLVLVVGHAISGFYLQEAARGIKDVGSMRSPAMMSNADFIEVGILA